MYKATHTGVILRVSDGAGIPPDPSNRDYQQYLADVENGTEVLLADPEPEPDIPPAAILRLLLEDVSDVDETKPILDAMLIILGG